MLDSSDIRNAVLELKKSILFVNRYEKAADAVAAIMGEERIPAISPAVI